MLRGRWFNLRLTGLQTVGSDAAVIAAIAGVSLLLHFMATLLYGYGYHRDEFYYIACGERLDFGYVDHPPLIALIANVTRTLFGDSLFALRLFPALAGAGMIVLAGAIVRQLGGGLFAQVIAALCAFIPPIYMVVTNFFSTVPFDHFFWALSLYLLVRLLKTDEPQLWLLIGLSIGVGLMNKHNIVFLILGLTLGLIFTPARKYFKSKWLWFGGLTALAIAAPYHLFWETAHGWPTLEFISNANYYKLDSQSPPEFLLQQTLAMNPITLPVWLLGIYYYFVSKEGRNYRLLGFIFLAPFVLFMVIQKSRPDYFSPSFIALYAGGAIIMGNFVKARNWGWLKPVVVGVLVIGGVMVLPGGLPVLPPDAASQYAKAVGLAEASNEKGKTSSLPQYYADMFGWEGMVSTIARVHSSLPPDEQAQATILTSNYGEAGAVDFLGGKYNLPNAISGHNNYYLWGPGDASGQVVISIGVSLSRLQSLFGETRQAAVHKCEYCMDYENDLPVYVSRNPKFSLAQILAELRHFE